MKLQREEEEEWRSRETEEVGKERTGDLKLGLEMEDLREEEKLAEERREFAEEEAIGDDL